MDSSLTAPPTSKCTVQTPVYRKCAGTVSFVVVDNLSNKRLSFHSVITYYSSLGHCLTELQLKTWLLKCEKLDNCSFSLRLHKYYVALSKVSSKHNAGDYIGKLLTTTKQNNESLESCSVQICVVLL